MVSRVAVEHAARPYGFSPHLARREPVAPAAEKLRHLSVGEGVLVPMLYGILNVVFKAALKLDFFRPEAGGIRRLRLCGGVPPMRKHSVERGNGRKRCACAHKSSRFCRGVSFYIVFPVMTERRGVRAVICFFRHTSLWR